MIGITISTANRDLTSSLGRRHRYIKSVQVACSPKPSTVQMMLSWNAKMTMCFGSIASSTGVELDPHAFGGVLADLDAEAALAVLDAHEHVALGDVALEILHAEDVAEQIARLERDAVFGLALLDRHQHFRWRILVVLPDQELDLAIALGGAVEVDRPA